MSNLLNAWRKWHRNGAHGPLPGDEALTATPDLTCDLRSWDAFLASELWARRSDVVHLGLLPAPYGGVLERASVFLLMLNPGFSPLDVFGEHRVPEYRAALEDGLRQNRAGRRRGFRALDPAFAWSGGFRYWYGKLRKVVEALAARTGLSQVEALALVRRELAVIQLFPYHSQRFGVPARILRRLRSVQLAHEHVHEQVLPRAGRGEVTVLVMRQAKAWGVTPGRGVVVYEGSESRGAHVSPGSPGGRAMLRALVRASR